MRPPRLLSGSKLAEPSVKSKSQPWKIFIALWILSRSKEAIETKLRAVLRYQIRTPLFSKRPESESGLFTNR